MINSILAGTDFSVHGNHAAWYAAALAHDLKSDFHLVFVNERPGLSMEDAFTAGEEEALIADREKLHTLVKEFQSKLPGLKVNAEVIHAGTVTVGLLHAVKEFNAELTVIGSTSTNMIERWLMGSTVSGMITTVSTPLVVIPPESSYKRWEHILIATDLSEENIAASKLLLPVAVALNAELRYLYIDSDGLKDGSQFVRDMVHDLRKHIDYSKLTGFMIRSSELKNGLDRFTASHRADLVVMITRATVNDIGFNSPSNTIQMVSKSKLPLFVVRL